MGRKHHRLIEDRLPVRCGRHERNGARQRALIVALCLMCILPSVASADSWPVTESAAAEATLRDSASADSVACERPSGRVILYYFHRTARCDNCLRFEAYTDSLVHAAFQPELTEGVLEWHVVNLDENGNESFVGRYALEGITLLSSIVRGGEEQAWRPLDSIWWLVDDRQAFADYVATEIEADLQAVRGKGASETADSLSLHRRIVPKPPEHIE